MEKLTYKEFLQFEEELNEYIESNSLQYGNADVYGEDGGMLMNIEAPNHTTLMVDFRRDSMPNKDDMINGKFTEFINKAVKDTINWFDVDEYFTEVWSREFSEHNSFTPTEFITILTDDKEFFESI